MAAMKGLGPLLLGLLLCCASGAQAQDLPGFPLDLARPLSSPQTSLMMLDRNGEPLPLGAPRFSLQVMGGHQPLIHKQGHLTSLRIDDAVAAAIGAAVGLGVADLGIVMPIDLVMLGQREGAAWKATRPGDLVVVPRVTALPSGRLPVSLVLSVPVSFPTGDPDSYSGRVGLTAEPRLLLTLHPGRLGIALRPGLLLQGGRITGQPHFSKWMTLRAAVGVDVGRNRAVRPEVGMDGYLPVEDAAAASTELLAGLVVKPGSGLSVSAHGGIGLGDLPGIARVRVVVAIAWEGSAAGGPKIDDRDADGIRDSRDACPNEPEDMDGHRDDDGCPDLDNDEDGIADPADACPDHPGSGQVDCPAGTVPADLDRDGLDPDDCPLQPEDHDGFRDEDGCPDLDNDEDGLHDEDDACPDRPEDGRRPSPRDGCPR